MKIKSTGHCEFCKKEFSINAIGKHLQSCPKRIKAQTFQDKGKVFLIKASSGPFWVYFEVNSFSTLKEIDSFLRDLWLECCGHLSEFTINNRKYAISPQSEFGDANMNISLEKVFEPGLKFLHEYDFGTTTKLNMKCISERSGKIEHIDIIAKNNLPEFKCKCGKPAKEICTECMEEGKDFFLCKSCVKNHECNNEMFLPVVNSPRMGMCGYTGN